MLVQFDVTRGELCLQLLEDLLQKLGPCCLLVVRFRKMKRRFSLIRSRQDVSCNTGDKLIHNSLFSLDPKFVAGGGHCMSLNR